jgi:hypothetical protein
MIGHCELLEKRENVARTVGCVDHLPKMRRSKQNNMYRMIALHALSVHENNKRWLHGPT